jgi:hypothetical protein
MRNLKRVFFAVGLAVFGAMIFAVPALATVDTTDPTGGAGSDLVDSTKSWVLNYGLPILLGLLFLGIVIRLLIRFVRRASRSV